MQRRAKAEEGLRQRGGGTDLLEEREHRLERRDLLLDEQDERVLELGLLRLGLRDEVPAASGGRGGDGVRGGGEALKATARDGARRRATGKGAA